MKMIIDGHLVDDNWQTEQVRLTYRGVILDIPPRATQGEHSASEPSQADSTSLATSSRHSEHFPTSNKSRDLTTPVKFVIVTACPHLPHQTLESKTFLTASGTVDHNLAAGPVNCGSGSMRNI